MKTPARTLQQVKDDERRDSEHQLLQAEEIRRTLEVKLAEAQRRSEWQRDTERQVLCLGFRV
jgi:hypothetical protein